MVVADNKQPLTTRLGAYEIIRPLARGGMAELFLVRATGPEGFEKVLVLKKILPHLAEDPRFVRSFLDEAKLVAGFDHPHIAHVHTMGTADGSYFFTMEFVHGVDVRTLLKRYKRSRTPLPFELAVLIVRTIASALHYAHDRRSPDGQSLNVVHRDVSPSNIIVSFEGVPKLVDFGIAKASSSSMRTQTGAIKGKIAYMSPEQAKGAPIDRRTDVFALGIILWELIANRRLYKGDNDMATIQRIIYKPAPSPRAHRRDCPPALERIVQRALALEIDARYQTAEQLELDLEDFALEHKLKQSSVALSAELKRTFSLELQQWQAAQAGAVTVTDAIALAFDVRTTTNLPIVVDDDDDDEDDDDDDDDREDSLVVPTVAVPVVPSPPIEEPRPDLAPRGNRRWIWIGGLGVVVTVGILIAGVMSTGGSDRSDVVAPAVEAVAAPPSPVAAPPSPVAVPEPEPEPEPEIEMAPVHVVKPAAKPEPKRVKKPTPRPKTETKRVDDPPPPKPKPAFDPNAVFPPSS